ncbi:MAG: hypothetical protein LBG64_00055 [Pseudomonadales bacterium]|jgi:hypothetical protein|nr:hypothetical protein [Pseudomonadales bacterium]
MVEKLKKFFNKLSATQILIISLVIVLTIVIIASLIPQDEQEIIISIEEEILDFTEIVQPAPPPHLTDFLSAAPNPEFSDISISPHYQGNAPSPSRQQLISQQDYIRNLDALAIIPDQLLQRQLEVEIINHFQASPPDFIYALAIVSNSVIYNPTFNQGQIVLGVVNHSGTTPTQFYTINFQIEPLMLTFELQLDVGSEL